MPILVLRRSPQLYENSQTNQGEPEGMPKSTGLHVHERRCGDPRQRGNDRTDGGTQRGHRGEAERA